MPSSCRKSGIYTTNLYRDTAPICIAICAEVFGSLEHREGALPAVRGFEKGLAGGGWQLTNPQQEPRNSPEVSPPSPKGLNLWHWKDFFATTPSVRQHFSKLLILVSAGRRAPSASVFSVLGYRYPQHCWEFHDQLWLVNDNLGGFKKALRTLSCTI